MADGPTSNLDQISTGQSQKEVIANALFDAASPATFGGRRASTCSGLTWGYYGGKLNVSGTITNIANGTLALSASSTCYIECDSSGNITFNTSAFTAGRYALYKVVTGASTVTSWTDERLSAVGISGGATGAVQYQGTWNANTNSPTLTSGSGTKGYYYVVSTAGTTTLDGISSWNVGDWAVFNGTVWEILEGSEPPVFGASGSSHSTGLVPDPGSSAGTTHYLREDATWGVPPGAGSVTSVALTMPGDYSVSGSPITGAGTLAVTYANESANVVHAGPSSGAAAAPTWRALVAADLPVMVASGSSHAAGAAPDPGSTAGTTRFLREDATWTTVAGATGGTVTSVALTTPGIFSVSGSPVTTSGTLAVSLATQSANLIFAGPSSGAAAAPTFRAQVVADLPAMGFAQLSNDVNIGSPSGGQTLVYDSGSSKWKNNLIGVSTAFYAQSTAPSSPAVGDRWVDTTSGIQYTYFNSGGGSAWVQFV
jgi:hypothetical protein